MHHRSGLVLGLLTALCALVAGALPPPEARAQQPFLQLTRPSGTPLLGVNLGRVGFLAETEPEAVEETLSAIEHCLYSVEERLALQIDVLDRDGSLAGETWALNEVSCPLNRWMLVGVTKLALTGVSRCSRGLAKRSTGSVRVRPWAFLACCPPTLPS